jgi:hypothetical protein
MLVLLTSFRSCFENLSTNGSLSMLSMQFPFALSSVEGLSGYSASQIFCRLTFRLRSLPDLLPIGQLLVFKTIRLSIAAYVFAQSVWHISKTSAILFFSSS